MGSISRKAGIAEYDIILFSNKGKNTESDD